MEACLAEARARTGCSPLTWEIRRVLFSVFYVLGYDRFDTCMGCLEENV
jgi:hypothetical protein